MMTDFQDRVKSWVVKCFGCDALKNQPERNQRFLEESLELVQSLGMEREMAHRLVNYVYDRPEGEPFQEVGGTLITLASLCECAELDMEHAGETELRRVWEKIAQIRAKQFQKPAAIKQDLKHET